MDGVINRFAILVLVRRYLTLLIHGLAGHVEHATHHSLTHGHTDWFPLVYEFHAPLETLGGAHGHGPHPVVTQMLLYLECQRVGLTGNIKLHGECVVDARQRIGKFRVHHRSDDLYNLPFIHVVNPSG